MKRAKLAQQAHRVRQASKDTKHRALLQLLVAAACSAILLVVGIIGTTMGWRLVKVWQVVLPHRRLHPRQTGRSVEHGGVCVTRGGRRGREGGKRAVNFIRPRPDDVTPTTKNGKRAKRGTFGGFGTMSNAPAARSPAHALGARRRRRYGGGGRG